MSFRKLRLNRDLIPGAIEAFIDDDNICDVEEKKNNLLQYSIKKEGKEIGRLNIYQNNDGTTTITPTGKNQDYSTEIAKSLVKNCLYDKVRKNYFILNNLEEEDFEYILEYLIDVNRNSVISDKEIIGGCVYKIRGRDSSILTFTFYNNGKLMVQGMALALFHETLEVLYETIDDCTELIKQQLAVYDINDLDLEQLKEEVAKALPNSYSNLLEKIRDIISPSIALKAVTVAVNDYTFVAFPALKGVEAILKNIFKENGEIIGTNGFGSYLFIDKTNGNTATLTTSGESIIGNEVEREVVCDLYRYLVTHRHPAFHVDGFVETTRTMNLTDAINLVDRTFVFIDTCISKLN